MIRTALTCSLFCLSLVVIQAQQLFFRTHQLEENQKNVKARLLFEDRQSLLWVGASEGLFRYDGLIFEPVEYADTTFLPVTAVYEDLHGRLWVGHEDGAIYFSENKQTLERWQPEEGLPTVPITGFAEDEKGNLWFSTYGEGLYCRRNGRLYNLNQDDGLLGDDLYTLARANDGAIWVGTDNGISVCRMEGGQKQIRNLTPQEGLPDEIVKAILVGPEGDIWIGMHERGVCQYQMRDSQFYHIINRTDLGPVTSLELFQGQELWVGTEAKGLYRFPLRDRSFSPLPVDDQRAKIYDLHKDKEGNIWVLSNKTGITSANRQFERVPQFSEPVQALLADRHNQLWIGAPSGLFRFHTPDTFREIPECQNLNIISLYQDTFGFLWIGTFGQGLYAFHPEQGTLRHFSAQEDISNPNILSIDGLDDKIWLATLGGVLEITLSGPASIDRVRNFNQETGLGANFIYHVFVDSRGHTWFGTDGKGAAVLENDQLTSFQFGHSASGNRDSIPLKSVYSITEDQRGHIWMSTAENGIFEYNGASLRQLTVKEGLRNLAVTGLQTTRNGDILIVHPKGIDLLNPATRHLIYFDNEVGISGLDPNLNALAEDQHGHIWIGDQETLLRYTPLKETLSVHPRILLKNVSIFLDPVDFRKRNRFSHRENNLVFDYIGLWYTDPKTVKYRYIMEGFDRDWITSADQRKVYSNLPPGHYTFKVSATENDAFNDEPIASYSFEIEKPFWTTWWFFLLTAMALLWLINLIVRQRERRLYRINMLEKEKIQSQFEALKNQINPHFLFNSLNTLITIIEEDPRAGVRYVEHFSDFFRDILQYRETDVISLEEEMRIVQNFTYLLRKRYGQNFRLSVDVPDTSGYVPPLTLQILVENAIKHNIISKNKPLEILIEKKPDGYLSITNNRQPKYTSPPSTGIGLQNIIQRYALLTRKKVWVEPSEDWFQVRIPLLQKEIKP